MQVRLLAVTDLEKGFDETVFELPELKKDEIRVQSVMTGVCQSDIDMARGKFQLLPKHMSGHEGLGIVVNIGANVKDVEIGNYVATRGEPAYADYYNVRAKEYIRVPGLSPKYILEPVACGVNVVDQNYAGIAERGGRTLLVGTGFMAWCAYHTLRHYGLDDNLDVLGSYNQEQWNQYTPLITPDKLTTYNSIIDLSAGRQLDLNTIANPGCLIVMGCDKQIQTGPLLWKNATVNFPSPRYPRFNEAMKWALIFVQSGWIDTSHFWTRGYSREREWKQAFDIGTNRPNNYNRGFITWQ